MPAQKIQIGQVWRKDGSEDTFLVTRLYSEALTTIAVLRPTSSAHSTLLRIKVEQTAEGQKLPGFTLAHSME